MCVAQDWPSVPFIFVFYLMASPNNVPCYASFFLSLPLTHQWPPKLSFCLLLIYGRSYEWERRKEKAVCLTGGQWMLWAPAFIAHAPVLDTQTRNWEPSAQRSILCDREYARCVTVPCVLSYSLNICAANEWPAFHHKRIRAGTYGRSFMLRTL